MSWQKAHFFCGIYLVFWSTGASTACGGIALHTVSMAQNTVSKRKEVRENRQATIATHDSER